MSSNNKVHSQGRNVPFSWEDEPGISKVTCQDSAQLKVKLPPPPCPPESARPSFHDLQIPLPPCPFQPPSRSSSRRGLKKEDDPFLIAYKECTKSSKNASSTRKFFKFLGVNYKDDHDDDDDHHDHDHVGFGLMRMNMSVLSCKHSCSVVDDSMIKISHLPSSKSQRERVKSK